ncbi:MAG: M42 family metallopeptidase [candidate division WOR-3 bacterium]|nr:M42 family metallopeptidase [candidate division WOR-3 bacterium]
MELIKNLTEIYGPSGREEKIRSLIRAEIKKICKDTKVDALGNLIAYLPAKGKKNSKKLMFCAHMDEIGLIVKHIDNQGFIRFANVGGIFLEKILHHRVIFENGTIGVIGVESKPETPKPPQIDNYYIDIGARKLKEAEKMVKIGDIASFYQSTELTNNKIIAKALDDRIGCYCLIQAMRQIKKNSSELYFVFSAQEEVGLRGARTSAFGINPDYAIAVDVTGTGDTPESPRMAVGLGKGVAIKIMDSAFIAHPFIKEKLVSYAQRLKIPYQIEVLERGTTDAAVIQMTREGVLSGVISVPTRYIHSPNEVCDLSDVDSAIKLIVHSAEQGFE